MHLRTLFISLLALPGLFLAGCATGTSSDQMVVKTTGAGPRHPESLSIKVTGGSEKSEASASQISNPDFTSALTKSFQQSGLFAKITPAGEPGTDFHLEVSIADLKQPTIGAAMTVTAETTWTITRASNNFVIWQKVISATHTTKASEAFTGVDRMKLAIDGAAQDSIRDGITQISALSLP